MKRGRVHALRRPRFATGRAVQWKRNGSAVMAARALGTIALPAAPVTRSGLRDAGRNDSAIFTPVTSIGRQQRKGHTQPQRLVRRRMTP